MIQLCKRCCKRAVREEGTAFCVECLKIHNEINRKADKVMKRKLAANRQCKICRVHLDKDHKYTRCFACRETDLKYYHSFKYKVVEHFGGACQICGEKDIRCLIIHHPDGDGGAHRHEVFGGNKTGAHIYRSIVRQNFDTGYRLELICSNCHLKKHTKLEYYTSDA